MLVTARAGSRSAAVVSVLARIVMLRTLGEFSVVSRSLLRCVLSPIRYTTPPAATAATRVAASDRIIRRRA